MKGSWLQAGKGNRRCLLFMAGWAMGPEPFNGLLPDDSACLLCYDYRRLDLPDLSRLDAYEQIDLLAWSMGVWVAARTIADLRIRFASATALAGTLCPIDDHRGIPVPAYEKMEQSLTMEELDTFYSSMFDDPAERAIFMASRPDRSLVSIREELSCLHQHIRRSKSVPDIFTRRIVTSRDRIFPARNQARAWRTSHFLRKKWTHFPFFQSNIFSAA